MSNGNLLLTSVPSGHDKDGNPIITVHVSPQLLSTVSPSLMDTWTSDVKSGTVLFSLAYQTSTGSATLAIKPNVGLLKPSLWSRFFEAGITTHAPTKAGEPAAAASSSKISINHQGVQLKQVVSNAQDFYQGYTTKVDLGPAGVTSLNKTATHIARTHSVYSFKAPTDTPASDYLSKKIGSDLAATRIFGNINPAAAFPPATKGAPAVTISTAIQNEIDLINKNQSTQSASPGKSGFSNQHIIHHIHKLKSVSRKTPANIVKSSIPSNPSTDVSMSFSQRITMLQNMPAFMEALGLVLEFTIPSNTAGIGNVNKLQVQLDSSYQGLDTISPWTAVDPALFLPLPTPANNQANKNPIIAANGYVDLSKNDYYAASIQPESATNHVFNFANHAALKLNGNSANPIDVVSRQTSEDYRHVTLPRSPHTDGLYVYQNERQSKLRNKSLNPPDPTKDTLYAEDLFHSFAVDVQPANGPWVCLSQRTEEYRDLKNHRTVLPETVREHGVRTALTRPTDTVPGNGGMRSSQPYVVDETLFTWRRGSLALRGEIAAAGPIRSANTEKLSVQTIPWITDFRGTFQLPKGVTIPAQRFGTLYQFALRPIYLTGRSKPFEAEVPTAAALCAGKFLRNEMVLGPQLIEKNTSDAAEAETRNLMFVSSRILHPQDMTRGAKNRKLQATPEIESSIRYLVPSPTTPSVARRHGKSEGDIKAGATTIPLIKGGALPTVLPVPPGEIDNSTPYLPDPMCNGIRAQLLFTGNTSMPTTGPTKPVTVQFYPGAHQWPNYALQCVELRTGNVRSMPTLSVEDADQTFQENNPGTSNGTRIIVCTLPPGMTAVMELVPTILPSEAGVHAFAPGVQNVCSGSSKPTGKLAALEDTNVCRPTVLRMTHATDIPVVIPRVILAGQQPAAQTAPGQLIAFNRQNNLQPVVTDFYEPYTTGSVSINATWTEKVDDLTKPLPQDLTTKAALYHAHLPKLPPGATATNIGSDYQYVPTTLISGKSTPISATLPFSDTKYRRLSVEVDGVSRYANLFPKDNRTAHRTVTYDFPSIAVPPVPDIEYILPTMEWTFAKDSQTRKCGLAVMLNRPWWTTGAGEQLALLLPPGSKTPTLPAKNPDGANPVLGIEEQVSAWGIHAIWSPLTGTVPDISITNGSKCITAGNPSQTFVTFDPAYDEIEQRWFCNLSFSDPPAYGVLMRLIFARYQPNSISTDLSLSASVMTDFALLGPSRVLQVQRSFKSLDVKITGVGPAAKDQANTFEVDLAGEGDDDHTLFRWREPGPTGANQQTAGILWHGTIDFDPLKTYTLVIREYETHLSFEKAGKTCKKLVYASAYPIGL